MPGNTLYSQGFISCPTTLLQGPSAHSQPPTPSSFPNSSPVCRGHPQPWAARRCRHGQRPWHAAPASKATSSVLNTALEEVSNYPLALKRMSSKSKQRSSLQTLAPPGFLAVGDDTLMGVGAWHRGSLTFLRLSPWTWPVPHHCANPPHILASHRTSPGPQSGCGT